ncbi:MAG: peptidylprolyl isomerase, partial [Proteobacteria bacterium]|nr:peptidylprolyl isomerase [Pseudomonadota bacterium]
MRYATVLLIALLGCGTPENPAASTAPTEAVEVEARIASEMLLLNWGDLKYVGDRDDAPGRTHEEALALAEKLRAEAIANPDTWSEMIQTHSDAPLRSTGGRVESWPAAQVPRDFHAITEVEVGGFTEVLDAHVGVVILRRVEPFGATTLSARRLLVAHKDSRRLPAGVTRTQLEAKARADELQAKAAADPDQFEAMVVAETDGWDREQSGFMGTWTVETQRYSLLTELTIETTPIGAIAAPIRTEFGYEIYQRLEPKPGALQLSGSHILISHSAAASSRSDRTRAEARTLATEIATKAQDNVRDFGTLATEHSDDGSAERGGDLGAWHVGKLPAEIEKAFTSMHFDEVGGPVETKYGFHVLHRRPSPA